MSAHRRLPVSRARAQLLAGRAAAFRASPSISEARLWQSLSGSKLGVAFRRQVVIGRYVADFVAPSVSLIVEVDGGYHANRVAADARRDRDLQRLGFRVLRVSDTAVMQQHDAVLQLIRAATEP